MSDFELSAAEFRALYARVKHMSRWGPADRRGALNNISATEVVAAADGVWRGRAVSLAAPIESEAALGNPDPAVHQMTHAGTSSAPASGLSFAMGRLALNIHGNAGSHFGALCHVIFDGTLCNGLSAGAVTAAGALSCPSRGPAAGSPAVVCCPAFRRCERRRGRSRVIT